MRMGPHYLRTAQGHRPETTMFENDDEILSRGKPNNRVTSRKVGRCFGRNLVTAHIASGQMSLATAVFLSGDTKSSHFRCGNRPMANPTMASGPSFIVSAKSKPAQPLAAARYFAAGDTSVGFSPISRVPPPLLYPNPSNGRSGFQNFGVALDFPLNPIFGICGARHIIGIMGFWEQRNREWR
jgi:hypothetical protein